MVAPLVASLIVTVTEPVKVPPPGLNVGVATCCWTVYVALATALLVMPLAAAIAFNVVVWVKVSAPE